jgi:hypothetical protein
MYARYARCYHEGGAPPNFALLKLFSGCLAAKTAETVAGNVANRQADS